MKLERGFQPSITLMHIQRRITISKHFVKINAIISDCSFKLTKSLSSLTRLFSSLSCCINFFLVEKTKCVNDKRKKKMWSLSVQTKMCLNQQCNVWQAHYVWYWNITLISVNMVKKWNNHHNQKFTTISNVLYISTTSLRHVIIICFVCTILFHFFHHHPVSLSLSERGSTQEKGLSTYQGCRKTRTWGHHILNRKLIQLHSDLQ